MKPRMAQQDDPDPDARREAAAEDELVVVSITDDAWTGADADVSDICRKAARMVRARNLRSIGDPKGEITIVLANDEAVRNLNREFRAQDKPTNVLSFNASAPSVTGSTSESMLEEVPPLGDVILGYETVRRESGELDILFSHHLQHLVVHGCLHLLGYDHEDDRDAERMESLETSILSDLGVPDPYEERSTPPTGLDLGGAV